MGIYMKYDGIDGEATQQEHKKWIDCTSISWGAARSIDNTTGVGTNREASEPRVSDVTITKTMDAASPKLFTEACAGNQGKDVKIELTTTGSPSIVYCVYTLKNAIVASYSVNSSSTERPSESVGISFTNMEIKFTSFDDKNVAGSPVTASYDVASTKKG
jgi:type VI secretion system secreted protein Hcp